MGMLFGYLWKKDTKGNKKKIPASEHYVAYPETVRGKMIWTLPCDARRAWAGVVKWR